MSQTSQCPECGKSLRIPEDKVTAVVKCPQCGAKFRASETSGDGPSRRGGASGDRRVREEAPIDDEFGALPTRSRKQTKKKSSASGSLQPFLRRWLIACGIVLAITAIIGVVGMFNEPVAITASMICIVAIIGCALAGSIWMAIDLGKESPLLAVGSLLMPAVGLVWAFQKKSPARRGAVVFVSLLAPLLLLGLLLLVFYPKYTGAGQRGVQTAKWEDLMRQMDSKVTPETPVVTVTVRVASRPGELDGIEPRCEALLRPFKCYVQDSLKIDAGARLITYQYRGSENFEQMIAFYLGSSTGAFTPAGTVKPDGT